MKLPKVDEKMYMKCLRLMSLRNDNDNYCHSNPDSDSIVHLLAVPMQTNVTIESYPASLYP